MKKSIFKINEELEKINLRIQSTMYTKDNFSLLYILDNNKILENIKYNHNLLKDYLKYYHIGISIDNNSIYHLSYNNIAYSKEELNIIYKELNIICNKIFDIINSI